MFIRRSSTYACSVLILLCLWQQFEQEGEQGRERKLLIFVWGWFYSSWKILWWQQKIFYRWGGKRPTEMSHLLQGVGSKQRALTHSSPPPSQAHEVLFVCWFCQFTPLWGATAALVLCGTKAGYSGKGLLRQKGSNILFRQEGRSWRSGTSVIGSQAW